MANQIMNHEEQAIDLQPNDDYETQIINGLITYLRNLLNRQKELMDQAEMIMSSVNQFHQSKKSKIIN